MPAHLLQAMPMLVLGLVALVWIIVRGLVLRRVAGQGVSSFHAMWARAVS